MAWKSRSKNPKAYVPPRHYPQIPANADFPRPPLTPEQAKEMSEGPKKLSNYIDMVEIREHDVEGTKGSPEFLEGEDRWIWIKEDTGAWSGPASDWRVGHKDKYFKYLKNKRVVITAGANQGMYVRFYAKAFGRVFAFEPDPLNFHCMVINNQVDNVTKLQAALGATNGFCTISRNGFSNTGTWTVIEGNPLMEGQQPIPVIAIDSLGFTEVDLIQLDVEGYEYNILQGAKETIKRCKPVVVTENGNREDICSLMSTLGYKEADTSFADKIWIPKD